MLFQAGQQVSFDPLQSLDAVQQECRGEHRDVRADEQEFDYILSSVHTTGGGEIGMRLILNDEERHHVLLRRIETTLRDALNWTHSPSALPDVSLPQQPVARDLVAITRNLVLEKRARAADGPAD